MKGRKQPRRWRQEATSDDLGSEEPSEAGQTANGEGDPSDQPQTSTQNIELNLREYPGPAPGNGAEKSEGSERGLNTPKPPVGSGFDVTSDELLSERKRQTGLPTEAERVDSWDVWD